MPRLRALTNYEGGVIRRQCDTYLVQLYQQLRGIYLLRICGRSVPISSPVETDMFLFSSPGTSHIRVSEPRFLGLQIRYLGASRHLQVDRSLNTLEPKPRTCPDELRRWADTCRC